MLRKLLTVGAVALLPTIADAAERFVPAFELKGPQTAKGVVVWSHGLSAYMQPDASLGAAPEYVSMLHDSGWDIIRYNRPSGAASDFWGNSKHLAKEADDLRAQGYHAVVLAGQSAGALISLMAAGKTQNAYAVIALAPACCGVDRQSWQFTRNFGMVSDAVADIEHSRVMIAFWQNDPYDPEGRGSDAEKTLSKHNVPHLVLDHPVGTDGHRWGNGTVFVERFGACVLRIMSDDAMPSLAECDGRAG
jgi:hypothetical protein